MVCRYTGVVHFFMLAEPLLLLHTPTHAATHNTTRWVLRAAANTCLHTMPCAAGELLPSMYSSIAHSCTNNTVVAGYHDSRRNTDTPYRSRYICSSCARASVFPGIPVCPVYRFFFICHFFFFFFFFHLTYSRRTSSLPSCLWSQRIFPSLPG